jgi:hypothetical protein
MKTIKQSKKAIFLIVGLINLNVYCLVAGFFPAIPIAVFVNSLLVILSLYLTGQSAIDVTANYTNAKIDQTVKEDSTHKEEITHTEKVVRPRDFESEFE